MQQEALEYGVCLSETDNKGLKDGHLVDKIEDLRQMDPKMFWSQKTLDEAFRICCVICEQSSGELRAVWQAGMLEHWNLWMKRFRENKMDLHRQLRDRQNTITIPRTSLAVGWSVLRDGVTWKVIGIGTETVEISRYGRKSIFANVSTRSVEVVLRTKQ